MAEAYWLMVLQSCAEVVIIIIRLIYRSHCRRHLVCYEEVAVFTRMTLLWNVRHCSLVDSYRSF
jgi:hypothetical protein